MIAKTTLNIAYAEDEETVRLGVIALLNMLGDLNFTIVAENGIALLNQMKVAKQLPDVVMLDIEMPGMDGFMLVDAIRKEWPSLPILVLTSHDIEFFVIRMFKKGANGYLLKDCKPRVIKEALFTIFNHGHYLSENFPPNVLHKINSREVKLKEFSEKDIEFLRLCCSEMVYADIAKEMGITLRSVDGLRDKLFSKYNINSRIMLVFLAIRHNFVPLDIIYREPE